MRTVIMHFYNEEYLLPWWLEHHRDMFDHGILIDYASTDGSAKICRSIVPDWRVVCSRNSYFDALATDLEVMQYENELPGWKIALNATEFLCSRDLSKLEAEIVDAGLDGAFVESAVMIDCDPGTAPVRDRALIAQKHHGCFESMAAAAFADTFLSGRVRLYHRAAFGAYLSGRHSSQLLNVRRGTPHASVFWYAFSPWQQEFVQRKLQIAERIPERDRKGQRGYQHLLTPEQLQVQYEALVPLARDLSEMASHTMMSNEGMRVAAWREFLGAHHHEVNTRVSGGFIQESDFVQLHPPQPEEQPSTLDIYEVEFTGETSLEIVTRLDHPAAQPVRLTIVILNGDQITHQMQMVVVQPEFDHRGSFAFPNLFGLRRLRIQSEMADNKSSCDYAWLKIRQLRFSGQ